MDAYVIVGNANTRRASVIRSLSGCFNRSVRDILTTEATRPIRVYARVGALQETRTLPDEFAAEAARQRCQAVLCALSASAQPADGRDYPAADRYIARFRELGWRIRAVAVLGQNAGGVKGGSVRQFPHASTHPINVTAAEVRSLFNWR